MNLNVSEFFLRLGRLSVYFFALIAGSIVTYLIFQSLFFSAVEPGSTEPVSFIVHKGANLKTIAQELEEQNIVKHWWTVYYPGVNKLKQANRTIEAGEYKLARGMTPLEILENIIDGEVVYYRYTIPEGLRLTEIADRIAATGLVTKEELLAAMEDRTLLSELAVPAGSLEGYLFPETYQFSRPITAREILVAMAAEGRKKITNEMVNRSIDLGFTLHQIITLASIIEKETGRGDERGKISSVFHNRLRIGMPLQSDPTVIYDIENFDGNLTKEHLKRTSPYNTYMQPGLPPGPICSPGLASITAALYPEDTDYLYFVSKGDGSHEFSSTLKAHNEAVNRYQRNAAAAAAQILDQAAAEVASEPPAAPPAVAEPQAKAEVSEPLDDDRDAPLSQLDPVRRRKPERTRRPKLLRQ